MNRIFRYAIGVAVVIVMMSPSASHLANAAVTYPEPKYVSDYAGILTKEQLSTLTNKVVNFEKETSNEIAVLIVPSTGSEPIEMYSIHVTDQWKTGKDGLDNGILFTIAVDDRTMRLEVGRGLEGAITDISATRALDTFARPAFRNGDYYKGISETLDVVMAAAKGEFDISTLPENTKSSSGKNNNLITILFYLAIGGSSFLVRYLSKTKSWWMGGLIGGGGAFVVAMIVTQGILASSLFAIFFGIIGLIIDFIVSKSGPGGGGGHFGGFGGWWGGGSSGSGFGGGSSGGGFGGGSFSGGGGSSSW